MTQRQTITLVLMALLMILAAVALGQWAERLNPEGLITHTPTTTAPDASASEARGALQEPTREDKPDARSAFRFGASMGLLAMGLLYCVIAAGLLLQRRANGLAANRFIVAMTVLAISGFALSYLIEDYFYP